MNPISPVYTLSPYFRSVLYSVNLSSKLRSFELFLPACFLPTVVCYCLFSPACHVRYPYHILSLISPWYLCGCLNVLRTAQVQWYKALDTEVYKCLQYSYDLHFKAPLEFPLILNVYFYGICRMACDCRATDINRKGWHSFSRKSSFCYVGHLVQTGSGIQPASYLVDIGKSSLRCKASGAWNLPFKSSSAYVN